ncbi:ribose ABC transporter permease [Petroclostridium sp. X23]|uniref:ABC transporter permease n=1 Tax=Petroclostridium sp. X23 TaxID=3045146 RepID=UPI0024ACF58F|nr:ribose ABC transporter permease [Petroclostridium sp. X23]WHH56825.1 ribose ABC transporter permease [Petroclostridium sp. X23]
MDRRKFWFVARKYATLAILVFFLIVMSILTDRFFTFRNLMNVGRQISLNAIISVGMTMVIISGGIDLSVGGIVALTGCLSASVLSSTNSIMLAIIVPITTGLIIGFINGFITSKTGIAPFIITLSSSSICTGATLVFTNASPIPLSNEGFKQIGQGNIIGIPAPVILMLIIFGLSAFVMSRTKFGRYVYAIGGNERASKVAGIKVSQVKTVVYIVSGALSALTAVIYTSRLSSGVPSLGSGYEMQAITAAVIGGASLSGGQGGIWGTLVGAVIIGILNNALNLLNINSYYQNIVTGVVVLLAVLFDRFIQTRINSES